MPLKRVVNDFKRQEERRRLLAELRIVYGNALSDSNLGRVQPKFVAGSASTVYPIGRPNLNSWQISSIHSTKRRSKPLVKCMPKTNSQPTTTWNGTDQVIARRYEILQRQALRHARFMNHLNTRQQTSTTGRANHKQFKFSSKSCNPFIE